MGCYPTLQMTTTLTRIWLSAHEIFVAEHIKTFSLSAIATELQIPLMQATKAYESLVSKTPTEEIVRLRDEGQTFPEIAAACNLPMQWVRSVACNSISLRETIGAVPSDLAVQQGSARMLDLDPRELVAVEAGPLVWAERTEQENFLLMLIRANVPHSRYKQHSEPRIEIITVRHGLTGMATDFNFDPQGKLVGLSVVRHGVAGVCVC